MQPTYKEVIEQLLNAMRTNRNANELNSFRQTALNLIAKLEAENKKLKQIVKDFYPEVTKYVKAEPFDKWLEQALKEE